MAPTVDDIYNVISKNDEYSSQLKKSGNQITVYTNISIKNKDHRKSKIREIRDYLKAQAPQFSSAIAYNENGKGSSIGRIEIGRGNTQTDIVVYLKPILKPTILQNWYLNEAMFADISTEYKEYADEDESSYNIIITDGIKNISIDDVKSVNRVGGENKKPDIKIVKNNGREYKISLKMSKFVSWESQSNSNPQIKSEAIKILNNLTNITAAFGKGSYGVSAIATTDEVKTVCFGGDGQNRVDYIVTADFPKGSLTKSFQYNQESKTLTIKVNKIYSREPVDYEELKKNCYMLITKVSNLSIALNLQYRGYQISFVPLSRVQTTIPGKR